MTTYTVETKQDQNGHWFATIRVNRLMSTEMTETARICQYSADKQTELGAIKDAFELLADEAPLGLNLRA